MNIGNAIITVVIGVFAAISLSFVMSYPAMLLWNGCVVGAISGVNPVGWLQMWGISILCSVLFKSSVSKKG